MSFGSSSVKTIADTGINESIQYAKNQEIYELSGINEGNYVPPQVQLLDVKPKTTDVEREQNFYVPPAKSWAGFASPEGFDIQRGRGLFGTEIVPSWKSVLAGGKQLLMDSAPESAAQETQKQKLIEGLGTLGFLNNLSTTVHNYMGRALAG